MKKLLVINGSRNYNSKGYKIISKIQKELDACYFETTLLDPNKLELEFCRGCKKCFDTGKCPLDVKDSGKLLKDSMLEADVIILLSPVYAHNVSGDIKNIIDRLSYWLHLFPLLGKPGIIITTTDTNGHIPVEDYLEHTICLWGIDIIYKENFYNTYNLKDIEMRINKIVEVIKQINFSKTPRFTSYQEAAFQNYKFAFSLNKETEEYKYWEENGLFCADSLEELYIIKSRNREAEGIV
ncbi:flavodoxin family protein [Blautia sp. HCP3S3_D9]|uniref:flavodoxin family protein n=1 Tax=unclassified Blautia TaxID=2648079 RepID=UPI002A8265C0|nr:flavodoxin family protein [Blautia sp.]MDY4117341.1 flavodoxin family protein [Blautia sp.]